MSFDGWRWDYTERLKPANLTALASRGVRVREMIPSFPVLTFPNHYTVVTGLYPDHHAIVANTFRDPVTGVRFSMSSDEVKEARWWGGEPIWVTAQRQGLRAATMFWPGTEAAIGGMRPNEWRPFDSKVTADDRASQVIEWLGLPASERPSVITLYFDDVDHAGHEDGPDTPQLAAAAAVVDRALGRIVETVHRLNLDDRVTFVIVSDHGMRTLSDDRTIWLEDYIDVANVDITESGATLMLDPRDGNVDAVYRRLHNANPHLHVYTRDTLPRRLHYGSNPRTATIIGILDDGWIAASRERRRRQSEEGRKTQAGAHGFEPRDRSMHALFVAAGPALRRGMVVPALDNVNVYDFLCAVLKLKPAPNDGSVSATRTFFR